MLFRRNLLLLLLFAITFNGIAQITGVPLKYPGKILIPIDYESDIKFSLQKNGKIVVAGTTGKGDNSNIFIARYTAEGNLDQTFASNGIANIDILGFQDILVSLNILPDDKIIVGAVADDEFSYRTLRNKLVIMKFKENGQYDNSFADNGRYVEYADSKYKGLMNIDCDAEMKIAGIRIYDSHNQFDYGVFRFNSDGSKDEGFGQNGSVNGSIRIFDDPPMDLAIQNDGKILIVGQSQTGPPPSYMKTKGNPIDVYVTRLNADGSLDNTFGDNGKLITMIKKGYNLPRKISVLPSGKIFVTGSVTVSKNKAYAPVFKFLNNGFYDTSFADKGLLTVSFGNKNVATDLKIIDDDNLYLTGTAIKNNFQNTFLCKIKEDGSFDTSFNKKGYLILNTYSYNPKIAVCDNSNIVLGSIIKIGNNYFYMLTRYSSKGKIDNTFGKKN